MVYECEKCEAALPAGVLNCPNCGEGFDEPVPQDAETPARGWQLKSELRGSSSATSELQPDRFISPAQVTTNAPQPKKGKVPVWLIIVAFVFLPITLLYLICLAVVQIWKHPTWSVRTKSLLTVLVAAAVVVVPVVGSVQDAQNQVTQQKEAMVAQSQQEATQRSKQRRTAELQATPQGRAKLAAERKQKELAAAEQSRQQKLIAAQAAREQAVQTQAEARQQNEQQAEENEKEADATYCKTVSDNNSQLTECLRTLHSLFIDPKFNDDDWKIDVAASLVTLNKISIDGQAISCPARFQAVQSSYSASLSEYEKFSDELPHAIDHQNLDEINQCLRRLDRGSELMDNATSELQRVNGN